MTRLLALAWIAAAMTAATPQKSAPSRNVVVEAEKGFDGAIDRTSVADPIELLTSTQGVYLEGYGTVFTAQVNLIMIPTLGPFRQPITPKERAIIRTRKVERLPVLRQQMRTALVRMAAALESMPPAEQVVLAVSLFHAWWEDTKDQPSQIIMQAERQALLTPATAQSAIRTREF